MAKMLIYSSEYGIISEVRNAKGKRTRPYSSPDPFSCYKMQRKLNERLQGGPNFLSHSRVYARFMTELENRTLRTPRYVVILEAHRG